MLTKSRYTYKNLEKDLIELNKTLEKIGNNLFFVIGARNNYTAIDMATKEQISGQCCQYHLIGGTPRECLAECNRYIVQRIRTRAEVVV